MRILLHICCGVCSGHVVESLRAEGHEVTGYFYNPNIYPEQEYGKRLEAVKQMSEKLKFSLISGDYIPSEWLKAAGYLQDEPEGGKRCKLCFRFRLEKTFQVAVQNKFDSFASTLSVSPHKSVAVINKAGCEAGGDMFLQRDFKKKDGFKITSSLARQHGIYRQHYCGCKFSLKNEVPKA